MDLDEILSQKLTNDKTAEVVEENYRGLLAAGCERDPRQEKTIKLNKLERLMTPKRLETITYSMFPDMNKFTIKRCPNCKVQIYGPALPKHCDNCGQALDWSGISNDSESE